MPCDVAEVQITEFRETDLPEILRIERISFPQPWSAEAFRAEAQHPLAQVRVLRTPEGQVLGYAVFRTYEQAVHLLNIAVDPGCRGQGLGRLLLQEVVRWAQKQHVPWVVLEVRVSNRRAQRFYERFGFRRIQRLPGYYGNEDGWLYLYDVPQASSAPEGAEE